MPFVGLKGGQRVSPFQVPADDSVTCPECGGVMDIQESYYRQRTFVSRHFRHRTAGDCEGESDEHRRMKTIVRAKFGDLFHPFSVSLEPKIGTRYADVAITFPDQHTRYGNGLGIEVQYRNRDKDKRQVTEEGLD